MLQNLYSAIPQNIRDHLIRNGPTSYVVTCRMNPILGCTDVAVTDVMMVDKATGIKKKICYPVSLTCTETSFPRQRSEITPTTSLLSIESGSLATDDTVPTISGSLTETTSSRQIDSEPNIIELLEGESDYIEPVVTTSSTIEDHTEPLETTADHTVIPIDNEDQTVPLETTADHTVVRIDSEDHTEPLETTADHTVVTIDNEDHTVPLETTIDHIAVPIDCEDQTVPLETTADHTVVTIDSEDHTEPLETTADHTVIPIDNEDQTEPLETTADHTVVTIEPCDTEETLLDNWVKMKTTIDHYMDTTI